MVLCTMMLLHQGQQQQNEWVLFPEVIGEAFPVSTMVFDFLPFLIVLQDFIVPLASLEKKIVIQKHKLVLVRTMFGQTYHCRTHASLNQRAYWSVSST